MIVLLRSFFFFRDVRQFPTGNSNSSNTKYFYDSAISNNSNTQISIYFFNCSNWMVRYRINHMHNSFPHPITFCTRLMFNLVRVGKEWASPVFPHPLTSNFRFYVYYWQGMVGWVIPHPINHMHKVYPQQIIFCTRLMFYLLRVGKEWASPVFLHPQN